MSVIGGLLAAGTWLVARLWALLRLQPAWAHATGGMWWIWAVGFSVALAATMLGSVGAPVAWPGWWPWIVGLGFELGLGSVIGLVVALPGYALVGAAETTRESLRLGRTRTWVMAIVCTSLA